MVMQSSIIFLRCWSGYLVAFVASSVPVFCWVCIHPRSSGLLSAALGNGQLKKHSGKSGLSLMSRPLDMKSKSTIGPDVGAERMYC